MIEDLASLRNRCESVIAELSIPYPFSREGFIAALSKKRGRRIELFGTVAKESTPCGMFAATPDTDYVFYSSNTSLFHQEHIIAHEIGHIWYDHKGDGKNKTLQETVAELLATKNLSASFIQRALGRTVYAGEEEAEAEMFASVILTKSITSPEDQESASDLKRFKSVFGWEINRHGRCN